jgi:excisionase family DNA binding protein
VNLRARLELMPPGTLIPADWVLAELGRELGPDAAEHPAADLTVDQVAERLGRAPSTIRNWLAERRLPGAYRLRGREWRIPPAALRSFLEAEAAGAAKGPRIREERADVGAWRQHLRPAS